MLFLKPLNNKEFQYLSDLIYYYCGINLHEGKKELVRARLCKRLRDLGLESFRDYCHYVETTGHAKELIVLIDTLSTNYTCFFRENKHFEFLNRQLPVMLEQKKLRNDHRFRLWSSGCSSGEEPYSLAIVLAEALAKCSYIDAKILATDISSKVLNIATQGVYTNERLSQVPPLLKNKYFDYQDDHFSVKTNLRRLITFRHLNIVGKWPFRGLFDIIFCRNVMIYFDRKTQQAVVDRFYDYLSHGGFLFLGHSESLIHISNKFRYIEPSVYQKV